LTISPQLLEELSNTQGEVKPYLMDNGKVKNVGDKLTEAQYKWDMNENAMATEKLAEGIRNFAADQAKLEILLGKML
jgi:transaldolase